MREGREGPAGGGASTRHAKLGCNTARGTAGGSKQGGTCPHGASGDGDHHVWADAPAPGMVPAMPPWRGHGPAPTRSPGTAAPHGWGRSRAGGGRREEEVVGVGGQEGAVGPVSGRGHGTLDSSAESGVAGGSGVPPAPPAYSTQETSAERFFSSFPALWWWWWWCAWAEPGTAGSGSGAPRSWVSWGCPTPPAASTRRYAFTLWCRALPSLESITRHSYVPSSSGFTRDSRSLWEMLLPTTFTTCSGADGGSGGPRDPHSPQTPGSVPPLIACRHAAPQPRAGEDMAKVGEAGQSARGDPSPGPRDDGVPGVRPAARGAEIDAEPRRLISFSTKLIRSQYLSPNEI